MFLARNCLLAGTLGLLVMAPLSRAQQANPQSQSGQDSATASAGGQRQPPAYQLGYQQGMEDRSHAGEPNLRYAHLYNTAQSAAYRSGYQAGYCRYEMRATGFYNGVYRNDGLPVLRNGYYGYNAPDPYCESKSGETTSYRRGDPGAPQNQVEYDGGG